MMSKVQQLVANLLEADPDEVDPKGELLRVDPDSDIKRIIRRFQRQDLQVHSWSRAGDILKIKASPLDTGMSDEDIEMGVIAELERMGIITDPMAVTVSRDASDGWHVIMFPLPGMPAKSHKKRRVVENNPDEVDPKDYVRKAWPQKRMKYSSGERVLFGVRGLFPKKATVVNPTSNPDFVWVHRDNDDPGEDIYAPVDDLSPLYEGVDPDEVDPKGYVKKLPPREKRMAYALLPSEMLDPTVTEVRPIIVKEGEPGYSQTTWVWNKQYAERARDDLNAKLGLTPTEAEYVMMSTMFRRPTNKRRLKLGESDPDEIDPKSAMMGLQTPYHALFSQIKPADNFTARLQVVLKPSLSPGEWVTRIKNVDTGGESWGHYIRDYAEAVKDFEARCLRYGLPTEPMDRKPVFEAQPDEVDPREYLKGLPARNPVVKISFYRTTPESAANGEASDSGWIDEEGEQMLPDLIDHEDGLGIVEKTVEFLKKHGATQPSASHFHPGVWYSTGFYTISYRTGEDEEKCYHLHGFEPDEEQQIFNLITRR